MTILERIKDECKKQKNISITTLEAELGYSNGSLAKAKDIPSSRILEISKYLNVPMEYLMTGEGPKINFDYLYTDENSDFLIEMTKNISDPKFLVRMQKYMELMNDSKKSVDDMIDFLHAKEHQGED